MGRDYDEIIKSTNLNVFPLRPGEDGEKATEQFRTALGMSYEEAQRTAIIGTPDRIAGGIRAAIEAGADYIIVNMPHLAYDQQPLHYFADAVITQFA